MKTIFAAILCVVGLVSPVAAQDSVFDSYSAYAAYVDDKITNRDFIPLIQRLGGRDEYTKEELAGINTQLLAAFPVTFENAAVFRSDIFDAGVRQEGRMYWTGTVYAFYYALLHERDGELVVINFYLNSSAKAIMERF